MHGITNFKISKEVGLFMQVACLIFSITAGIVSKLACCHFTNSVRYVLPTSGVILDVAAFRVNTAVF
jgi:hypothetical protein